MVIQLVISIRSIWIVAFLGLILIRCSREEPASLQRFDPSLVSDPTQVETIAFGSCSHQDSVQKLWPVVMNHDPDLWIWLGDNVYGDTEDMFVLEGKYDKQKSNSDYLKMRQLFKIIGVWDDHDYGVNDGGKEYPRKRESRDLLFDFLDVTTEDPARQREGAYQAYVFGQADRRIKLILLDTRYFRDPVDRENGTGDILGELQWDWLADQLKNSDAQLTIIGSSIRILNELPGGERWGDFPAARQRFLDLLEEFQPGPLLIISGDIHIAELIKKDLDGLDFTLYDFTSSGLTHTWNAQVEFPNPMRVGDLVIHKNFGIIKVNWDSEPLELTLQARGQADSLFLDETIRF